MSSSQIKGPRTPPRRRIVSNTSDLSPSRWNAMNKGSPLSTSPVKFAPHYPDLKRSPKKVLAFPDVSKHAETTTSTKENQTPSSLRPRVGAKIYNSSTESSDNTPDHPATLADKAGRKSHSTERCKAQRDREMISSASNPFVRSCSNISRKRANAVLMDSPARRSHSQQMAKIFEAAKETVMLQDQIKKRANTQDRPLFAPPQRPRTSEEWHKFRKEARPGHSKPLPKSPEEGPSLPDFSPVGRLSDDIPTALRIKSPLKPVIAASSSRFEDPLLWDHSSPTPQPLRRHAAKTSIHSGISLTDDTRRQHLNPIPARQLVFYNEPWSASTLRNITNLGGSPERSRIPVPVKPGTVVVKRNSLKSSVRHWLDGIDVPTSPSNDSAPDEADRNPQIHAEDQRTSSSASISLEERDGWLHLPSQFSSHHDFLEDIEHHIPLLQRPKTPLSFECRGLSPAEEVVSLTPEVEVHRKGQGPARKRCPSYYDGDILQ